MQNLPFHISDRFYSDMNHTLVFIFIAFQLHFCIFVHFLCNLQNILSNWHWHRHRPRHKMQFRYGQIEIWQWTFYRILLTLVDFIDVIHSIFHLQNTSEIRKLIAIQSTFGPFLWSYSTFAESVGLMTMHGAQCRCPNKKAIKLQFKWLTYCKLIGLYP